MNKAHWTLVIAGLIAVMAFLPREPDRCGTYDEMRQVWENTNGEWGWPKGAVRGCEDD